MRDNRGVIELWHNPRCSKSRAALALLEEAHAEIGVRRYLENPPDANTLGLVLDALGKEPWEIARTGESVAREIDLPEPGADRERWIELMVANPILIERPIAIDGAGRAVLGRPPEDVLGLVDR